MARFSQRLPSEFFLRVQNRLREQLAQLSLDGVLTDDPDDVAYLTGFFHHPCERPVAVWLPVDGDVILLLPELERHHAQQQSSQATLVSYPEYPGLESPFHALARVLPARVRRIGTTPTLTHHRATLVAAAFGQAEFVSTDVIMQSRYRKEPEEIALHQEAARITDAMLSSGVQLVVDAISSGGPLPSEAELASHVGGIGVGQMYQDHDDVVVVSFMAGGLVYSGANSALPHGLPSSYRLQVGDTFMLSLGAAVGGRFVEGERTFILGEPTPAQQRYHDTIRQAQAEGSRAIAPGVLCSQSNQRCLNVIREAGLGEYLRHRQGHGIGLGMHEPPWLEDGDNTELEPGMIVSNEPGIYIPGHAGYRISDSMLVTDSGSRPLTSYPRSLDDCVIPFPV